jgi:hypothetical protein
MPEFKFYYAARPENVITLYWADVLWCLQSYRLLGTLIIIVAFGIVVSLHFSVVLKQVVIENILFLVAVYGVSQANFI